MADFVDRELLAALEHRNQAYIDRAEDWNVYDQVYAGGSAIRSRLIRHLREHDTSFKVRKARAYFINYSQTIIDQYVSYIFRKPIQRTLTNQGGQDATIQEEFYSDADLSGRSLNRFMKDVARKTFIFGHMHVLVDTPVGEGSDVKTEQERKATGRRPFLSMITPKNMVDWALDRHGNFVWVRWVEDLDDNDDPFAVPEDFNIPTKLIDLHGRAISTTPSKKAVRFKTWTKKEWVVHEVKNGTARKVDGGDNLFGSIPIVTIFNAESTINLRIGISMLVDIAWMNLAIFNWLSLLDEELHQKTFNILTLQQMAGDEKEEIVIGQNNVLTYTGTQPPGFITPSTAPAGQILETIASVEEKIYRLSKLGGLSGNIQRQSQSGVAHAFSFNETNQALVDRANNLEVGEREIHELYWRAHNLKWEGVIDYPEEFGVELFLDELEEAMEAKKAINSKTFRKETEQRIAKRALPKLEDNVMKTIEDEIGDFYKNEQVVDPDADEGKEVDSVQGVGNGAGVKRGKALVKV